VRKGVSPLFAVIVILVALALGALWSMAQYREHETRKAQAAQVLQQQADRALRSGRLSAGRQRRLRGGTREPGPGTGSPADVGRGATGGESVGE
jgi:type II secretory pathway pseudopilin PulG